MLNLCLFKWFIIILATNQVLSTTRSSNVCKEDTDALEVVLETGDALFAGTDCDYTLLVRNDNGVICQQYTLDNSGNDRERNSIDQYRICCPKNFLNHNNRLDMLAFIQLGVGGKYPGPCRDDWLLERIELRAYGRHLFNYTFHEWTSYKRKVVFGLSKINGTNYIRF